MAMNPAAKDSNAFASSNLSGGAASNAILGVPQNPPMPSGPQPSGAGFSPLAQQNNQSVGPQFWNTVSPGAPGPTADPQPNYADQIAQHNAQMLQQMQAQYAPPQTQSSSQPVYGIGPNGELQVGDQVVPMQDNPTMAANLIQQSGNQSTPNLRPGFRPVFASDVQQQLANVNRSTWDTTKEVGKQLLGGAVAGIPKVAGAAADWLGAPGAGAALTGAGQAVDRALGTDQPADTLGRGTIAKSLVNNAYGAGMGLPLAAANIGLTMAGQPEIAAGLDLAVAGPLFGGAAAKETSDKLLAQGASPEQANLAGWQQFFLTGAAQAATNFVGGRVMAGGGYTGAQQVIQSLKSAVGKGALTAEQAAQMVTEPALLSRFAANQGVNLGLQGASMAGQGAATAGIHNANAPSGAPQDDPLAAAGQGLEAGLATGVLMSPLGIHSQMVDSARRAQMGHDLNTPMHEVDLLNAIKQDQTAKAMTPEVGSLTTPAAAKEWAQGVNTKAFNNADGNQFAADTKAQQAAQTAYDTAQVPPVVPKTPEQLAAEKAAIEAAKVQAKADKERSALAATNALIELGVAQPKGKDVSTMADILASGVDLSATESATLRDALLARKYNLAKTELARLKGTNDSVLGQARTGDAGVGGAGGDKPAGSVGAGVPVAGKPGAVQPSAGEPVASVQPPVVGRDAGVPPAPVTRAATGHENTGKLAPVDTAPAPAPALPTKAVRPPEPPRPDFHLAYPGGEPSKVWHLPEEPAAPEQTDNMRPNLGKETGQKQLFPLGARGEVPKAPKPPKRPILPKDLAPVQAAVNQGVPIEQVGEHAPPVKETAEDAKRSRKRQEEDAATEAAKTPEQHAAEAAEKTVIPPVETFKVVFGNVAGQRIHAAANGENWVDMGKREGVHPNTPQKMVKRQKAEVIDKAMNEGKITPDEARALHEALSAAKGDVVQRKTDAAIAQDGGVSTTLEDNLTSGEKQELMAGEGMQVHGADNMGVKSKAAKAAKVAEAEQAKAVAADEFSAMEEEEKSKPQEGYGTALSLRERNIAKEANAAEELLRAAQKAKDGPEMDRLQAKLKKLEKAFLKGKNVSETTAESEVPKAADIEDRIAQINEQIGEAEDAGDHELAGKLADERQELYDKRDASEADGVAMDKSGRIQEERDDWTARDRKSAAGGISKEALQPIVDKIVSALGGDPSKVQVHDTAPGKDSGSVGGRVDESGVVHLYRDGISGGLEGQKTLFHELFHAGLRKMGIEYHRVLNQLYQTHERVRTLADDWMATPEGQQTKADYEAKYPDAKNSKAALVAHATDEALARIAEELKTGTGLGTAPRAAMVRGIAKWMAKLADSFGMHKLAQAMRSMTYTKLESFVQEAIERSVGDRAAIPVGSRQRIIEDNIHKLPEKLQDPVRNATDSFTRWGQSAVQHVTFTRDLVKQGVAMGMHALEKYEKLRESQEAMSGHFRKLANDAIEKVRSFSYPEKHALSDFLQHSTLSGEWGYGPKRVEGSKAAEMFDKLSPGAQKVAQKVFEHGAEILKAKKEAITKLADDTYGDMLAEAQKAGNTKLADEITADRSNLLKRYDSLMKIDSDRPYTSARRQGDWVVVGKSKEFLEAEKSAQSEDLDTAKAGQKARMDMIDDASHYLVHEAQSPAEARELVNNMRAMGFPEDLANTYYHAKDKWKAQLEGGQGVLAGMARLRSQIDNLYGEAKTPEDKAKYETSRKLLTNMWLDALGSASARKSELRRLGVNGSMDMIKAFRLQSSADAHFISGIHHNAKMLNALKAANKEVFKGNTTQEELNKKQALYDEFMKRHDLSMNAPPTPVFNKIAQYTALWQIATSPGHYLGNLMQPWAMTLPYLAGRHGYAVSTKEFGKAYAEIGDILARTGVLDSLKVSDMPADVRSAMSRLLELGRLDIGMNTEYGSLELKERNPVSKAAQVAVDRIRQASLKMESLNRLASAAAAYRLEMARTGDHEASLHYAADVVAETHGDYSSTNAPRMFNSGLGKMALQFRKFQLVQLTYMAKLIGNLKDADPETRAVAARTLMYTLGHVGVLGGALAMPGFSTFSAINSGLTKALTGVAGEDWETKLEKMIGDRDVAQLILRGVPGLAGIDLTKKVGFGDMLGVAPMASIDPTKASSVKETLGDVLSGPFGGLLERGATAIGHMQRGDMYKGIEGLMPEGVMNAMKGLRTSGALEGMGVGGGVTNTKGDKLMDVSAANAVLQALGFTPSKQAMQSSETGAMTQSTEEFKDRLDVLKTRYTNAAKSGGDVAGAVKNLNELRLEMIDRGFRPTPLGAILKAPMEQLKREMFTTPGGVQYQPKQDMRAIAQLPK